MIATKPLYNPDGTLKTTFNPNIFVEPKVAELGLSNYANKYTSNTFTANNTFANVNIAGTFTKGVVSDAELNYLDGLTQNIQTKFNAIDTTIARMSSVGIYTNSVTFASVTDIPRYIIYDNGYSTSTITLPLPTSTGQEFKVKLLKNTTSNSNTVTVTCVASNKFKANGQPNPQNGFTLLQGNEFEITINNGMYYMGLYISS